MCSRKVFVRIAFSTEKLSLVVLMQPLIVSIELSTPLPIAVHLLWYTMKTAEDEHSRPSTAIVQVFWAYEWKAELNDSMTQSTKLRGLSTTSFVVVVVNLKRVTVAI